MKGAIEPAIVELASALGRRCEGGARMQIAAFVEMVQTWNAKLDLTAARDPRALVEVLCADALVMSAHEMIAESARLLDVGSGSGAPALALAPLRPDVSLTMVEPLRKRVAFLRTVIGSLDLARCVNVIERKIDEKAPESPGPFDVASARATFAPEVWLGAGLSLAPACLVFAVDALPIRDGAVLARRADYTLPSNGAPRMLARCERAR